MDVDGTLTDGKIYIGDSGEIFKAFNVKDGYGIYNIALPAGIEPVIITGRVSEIVSNRCKEIGIKKIFQGVKNKSDILQNIVPNLSQVAYIGDDINDFECMKMIKNAGGRTGCPKDAVKKIKKMVDYISEYNGGEGAVRDYIEWLLAVQTKTLISNYK